MSLFIFSFKNSEKYKVKKRYIIFFIFFFMFTLISFEGINRSFIYRSSENFLKLKSLEKEKGNAEIIFLGDSHFGWGIDLNQFKPKSYNMSFTGANYIQSYYILKRYIDEMPALRIVVVQLSLHSFRSGRSDRLDTPIIFWDRFIDYKELSDIKGKPVHGKKYMLTLFSDILGRKFFLENLAKLAPKFIQRMRSSIEEKEVNIQAGPIKDVVRRRVEFHFKDQNVFDKDLLTYFEKILKLCKEKNILVVVVQTPESEEYIRFASNYINPIDLDKKIASDKKYSDLIDVFLDFSRIYSDNDIFFRNDGDHLNSEGGKHFSKLLSEKLSKVLEESRKN